jgi:hypothetical protein
MRMTTGIASVLLAVAAASGLGASGPASAWTTNGASACQKLLTPQFLSAILVHADGKSEAKPDGVSCVFGAGDNSITIALSDHVTLADWNRMIAKNLFGKNVPLSGVGDRGVRSEDATSLHAHTNGGRMCSVVLMPLGDDTPKLTGEALAKKLGTLCNQLFALP